MYIVKIALPFLYKWLLQRISYEYEHDWIRKLTHYKLLVDANSTCPIKFL